MHFWIYFTFYFWHIFETWLPGDLTLTTVWTSNPITIHIGKHSPGLWPTGALDHKHTGLEFFSPPLIPGGPRGPTVGGPNGVGNPRAYRGVGARIPFHKQNKTIFQLKSKFSSCSIMFDVKFGLLAVYALLLTSRKTIWGRFESVWCQQNVFEQKKHASIILSPTRIQA